MAFVKVVNGGYIIGVGKNQAESGGITEAEYNQISELFKNRPQDPSGYKYQLRADNLEWELVELPPAPEYEPTVEDKAEAYDILMGEEDGE